MITGEQPGMISLLGKGLYLEILSWEHRISDLKEFFKDYPVQTSDVINQTQGDLPALTTPVRASSSQSRFWKEPASVS